MPPQFIFCDLLGQISAITVISAVVNVVEQDQHHMRVPVTIETTHLKMLNQAFMWRPKIVLFLMKCTGN